jgi:hypothetical protein
MGTVAERLRPQPFNRPSMGKDEMRRGRAGRPASRPSGTFRHLPALLEIRDGFPYSLVKEDQAFVGARNTGGRLPALYTLDVSLLQTARVFGQEVRLGVRVFHLLNTFAPRDLQNNVDSAASGSVYHGLMRRIMLTVQLTAR